MSISCTVRSMERTYYLAVRAVLYYTMTKDMDGTAELEALLATQSLVHITTLPSCGMTDLNIWSCLRSRRLLRIALEEP